MDITLRLPHKIKDTTIAITGSKSETNRLLLLKALYPDIQIANASESDDSVVMQNALEGNEAVIDVHHAGTAMRFLTAYFAMQEGREVVLTGSQRMKERPIAVLVDALRALGARIEYMENEGFPPLRIIGQKLVRNKVTIKADVSSQYITALLLIAGRLENGLELTLEGKITSRPYIDMTLSLLDEVGIKSVFSGNKITVSPQSEIYNPQSEKLIESDWSSASYYYSIVALSETGTRVTLTSYRQNSRQGDSALADIYSDLGVETTYTENAIILLRAGRQPKTVNYQLNNTPDIAQTIAVTCLGLGIGCHLTGLHTLKIKETDRLAALKVEIEKFGAQVWISADSLTMEPGMLPAGMATPIATYNDHRMAMAFAPLAIKIPVTIQDAGVVSKSYPSFWDDLEKLGFVVQRS